MQLRKLFINFRIYITRYSFTRCWEQETSPEGDRASVTREQNKNTREHVAPGKWSRGFQQLQPFQEVPVLLWKLEPMRAWRR